MTENDRMLADMRPVQDKLFSVGDRVRRKSGKNSDKEAIVTRTWQMYGVQFMRIDYESLPFVIASALSGQDCEYV